MLYNGRKSYRFALNGTALALIAALGPGLALGQTAASTSTAPASPSTTAATEDEGEEIVVTGTSVRGVAAVGSETITLGREEIEATGLNSVRDVLGTLPQFQNNVAGGQSETPPAVDDTITRSLLGTNAGGINGINLRGLGNGATMVLLNGFRTASSGAELVVDPSSFPLSALERIDIVADGVSSVYGSDAVAGVVNFILRKDYAGLEGGTRYTWQDGGETKGANITAGVNWDFLRGGSIMLTLDYNERGAQRRNFSPYLMDDKSSVGGPNEAGANRTAGVLLSLLPYIQRQTCTVGALVNGVCTTAGATIVNTYFAINPPATGTSKPTAAQVLAGGAPVFVDSGDYADHLGQRIQKSATFTARQDLNDIFTLRMQGSYSTSDTKTRSGLTILSTNALTTASPSYITGLFAGNPQYNVRTPLGVAISRNYSRVLNTGTALDFKLPADWRGDLTLTYNFSHDYGTWRARGDGLSACAMLTCTTRAVAAGELNYYSNTNVITDTSSYLGETKTKNSDVYKGYRLKFDGPLFSLPGGKVKAAVGAEYSEEHASRDNYSYVEAAGAYAPALRPNDVYEDITSFFTEVHVPLVSAMNKLPFVESLNFSAAVRTDDYASFGRTTNPRYGLDWEPHKDLRLRASYGTSFRSPGLNYTTTNPLDNNVLANTFQTLFINNAPTYASLAPVGTQLQTVVIVGRSPHMDPETSKNSQLGFDYTPTWFDGFKLSGTWYHIDYKNRIDTPNWSHILDSDATAAAYAEIVYKLDQNITNPGKCSADITNPANWDPVLQLVLGPEVIDRTINQAGGAPALICSGKLLFDGRLSNLAQQIQEGYDLTASYRKQMGSLGQFNTSVTLTKVTKVEAKAGAGLPLPNVMDVIGGVLSTRARANIGWSNAGFNATLAANYTGAYINDRNALLNGVALPDYEIGSNLTYDLTLGYRFGEGAGALENLRTSLSVVNLTDKNPPYAYAGSAVYDFAYANPYGRIFTVRLTKDF